MSATHPRLTRRALLVAGAGLVVGCTRAGGRAPVPDPDAAAVRAARDAELSLLAAYDATSPAYAAHLAHLRALGVTAPSPPPAAVLPPGAAAAAERATIPALQSAATAARGGGTAAVLASIAASHAVLAGAHA